MPKAPLSDQALAMLRRPNPAVIATVLPSGHPMSVATWYLLEDDGTILVNMDAGRARLRWIEQHPYVSLTVLAEDAWYAHVSLRGPVVRWERDADRALADIDRLSQHYGGGPFRDRTAPRVSAWIDVEHWHGWEID